MNPGSGIKAKIITLITFLPAFGLAVVIFGFSSQNAEISTVTSTFVGRFLIGLWCSLRGLVLSPEALEEGAVAIDGVVRKLAHMTEYGILGISLYLPILRLAGRNTGSRLLRAPFRLTLALIGLYALSDEIHQLFVPGRAGMLTDVLIDLSGAFLALFFTILFFPSLKKK